MLALLVLLGGSMPARAESTSAALARSNALFAEGKRQLNAGEVAAACSTFAESHRLVPRGGTLLNLALCREREGKLIDAFRTLHEALAMARQDDRDDRIAIALEHIAGVEARLSWVELQLPGNVDPAGLTVRLDRSPVVHREWSAIPIQPGAHVLEVEGEGVETWRTTFSVEIAPRRLVIVVPALSPRETEADDSAKLEAPVAAAPKPSAESASARRLRRLRYAALGIGAAGIVTGAVTGGLAIRQRNSVREHCDDHLCDGTGKEAADRGGRMIHASTVGWAVGAAGLATWLLVPGGVLIPRKGEASLTLVHRF